MTQTFKVLWLWNLDRNPLFSTQQTALTFLGFTSKCEPAGGFTSLLVRSVHFLRSIHFLHAVSTQHRVFPISTYKDTPRFITIQSIYDSILCKENRGFSRILDLPRRVWGGIIRKRTNTSSSTSKPARFRFTQPYVLIRISMTTATISSFI